jgi:hypothetical protein
VTIDGVLLKDGGVGSATAAIAAYLSSINGGQIGGNRNLIINGAMQVAQRGTSSTDAGYGSVDRFSTRKNNFDELVLTHEQVTDAPTGFSNSLKYTVSTPETTMDADENARIEYRIEGQDLQHLKKGTSDAVSLSLSFWVKGSITGTYIAMLVDNDNSRNICASYTINSANTWEYKTLTYAGDTTGTLDNDNLFSFAVRFWLGAGTDRTSGTLATSWQANVPADVAVGQTNILTTSGATFQITGVQLEVGEQATPFEHRSFADELDRCKRYYQKSFAYDTAPVNDVIGVRMAIRVGGDSVVYGGARVNFEKTMRATPTATAYNPQAAPANSGAYLNDINNSSTTIEYAITATDATTDSLHFYVGGFNQGGNDFGCNWTADAEL